MSRATSPIRSTPKPRRRSFFTRGPARPTPKYASASSPAPAARPAGSTGMSRTSPTSPGSSGRKRVPRSACSSKIAPNRSSACSPPIRPPAPPACCCARPMRPGSIWMKARNSRIGCKAAGSSSGPAKVAATGKWSYARLRAPLSASSLRRAWATAASSRSMRKPGCFTCAPVPTRPSRTCGKLRSPAAPGPP